MIRKMQSEKEKFGKITKKIFYKHLEKIKSEKSYSYHLFGLQSFFCFFFKFPFIKHVLGNSNETNFLHITQEVLACMHQKQM